MTHRLISLSALLLGTALITSACSVAPPMSDQEAEIKSDLAVNQYMPATRQMRDAIETQELFAQAAFWSNEYDLNPGDLESALKLAAVVRKLGNPGRAVEITQTTRALYPRDPYLLAEHGAALIASERALDAIPILNEGLSIAPSMDGFWSLKGAALDQQERYAEARQHYDRALRITPNDPNVMANIGLSHALAGDAATAEGWLRRASSLPGASSSVRQNLILVLKLQGKTQEAEKLAGLTRRAPKLPTTRPAHSPMMRSSTSAPTAAAPYAAPRARMMTGATKGQQFSTASDAARAMAGRQSSSAPITTSARPRPKATPEEQQAVLDRILQSRGGQARPNPPAPQSQPMPQPQTYPQPTYTQQPPLAGAPQPTPPQRRAPNRRRR